MKGLPVSHVLPTAENNDSPPSPLEDPPVQLRRSHALMVNRLADTGRATSCAHVNAFWLMTPIAINFKGALSNLRIHDVMDVSVPFLTRRRKLSL